MATGNGHQLVVKGTKLGGNDFGLKDRSSEMILIYSKTVNERRGEEYRIWQLWVASYNVNVVCAILNMLLHWRGISVPCGGAKLNNIGII